MNFSCKICDSDKKAFIEEMILSGESNKSIADMLNSMGIDISHATVNRHKTKHMLEHIEKINELATPKGNQKYGVKYLSGVIDEDVVKTASSYIDKLNKDDDLKLVILNDTLLKQMALVRVMQEKYINGECKFPYEEIKALDCLTSARNRYLGIVEKEEKILAINALKNEENPFARVDRLRQGIK